MSSPASGIPREVKCTLIWCVRPVSHSLPVGDGSHAAFADLPLYAVSFHDPYRRVDGSAAGESSLTNGVIDLVGVSVQERRGVAVLGGQHKPAGVAVETVDDPEGGVRLAVCHKMCRERVGQGIGDVFPGGMHRHMARLVDNGDVRPHR